MDPSAEERLAEKIAVIARLRSYLAVMQQDKRMRVMANILLGEIDRAEREEAARTERGERR